MKRVIVLILIIGLASANAHAELVSYWAFDEGEGTTAYDSANSYNGTIQGASWTEGKFGNALSFDALGDFVYIPDLIPENEGTFTAWVKSSVNINNSTPQRYNSLLYSNRDQIFLGSSVSGYEGNIRFIITPTPGQYSILHSNKDSWNANEWYHIACTWDGTTQAVYVNGFLDKSQPQTYSGGWGATYIGGVSGVPLYSFDGVIDDVRIYNNALSPGEIREIIPEPATVLLLGLGGLILRKRRR